MLLRIHGTDLTDVTNEIFTEATLLPKKEKMKLVEVLAAHMATTLMDVGARFDLINKEIMWPGGYKICYISEVTEFMGLTKKGHPKKVKKEAHIEQMVTDWTNNPNTPTGGPTC